MEYVNLGDVATYINGYAFKPEQRGKKGLPIIRIQDLNGNSHDLGFFEGEYPEQVEINTGDILISWSGSLGVYKWNKGKALLNQHIFKVQFNKIKIDKEYFCYAIRNSLSAMSQQTHGATMKHITKKDFDNILIPYPDLNVQRQIANNLETVNELIESYEKELILLEQLVKARFVEMFGDIDNNIYDYDIRCLNDVCEFIKDGTHQTPIYTQDKENGYKFMSSKDVVLGSIDWDHLKYIPEDLHKELYKHISPRRGDILLAKNGTTGIAAMVDRDEVFDIYVSLAILRPLNINSTYLLFAINSNTTKRQFDACLKGIGVPNLHLGEIKKAKIIVPPLDKQIDFEKYAKQVDKSKLAVQQSLEKMKQLFDSLMQEYFG